jgi:hypothetical protein
LPSDFPAELLPRGAAVNLTAISSTATTVVATVVAGAPLNLLAHFDGLKQAGWAGQMPATGGFYANLAQLFSRPDAGLCKGSSTATVIVRVLPNRTRLVRAAVKRNSPRPCDPGSGGRPTGDFALPLLELPDGVDTGGRGFSLSGAAAHTRTELVTTRPIRVIAEQLVMQLEGTGWTLDRPMGADAGMAVARLTGIRGSGDRVAAVLALTGLAPGSVDALLYAVRTALETPAPSAPRGGRGGRGAAPIPTDVERLLNHRDLTRTLSQRPEIGPSLPDGFPRETLPRGMSVHTVSVAPSITVVVGPVSPVTTIDSTELGTQLQTAGWTLVKPPMLFSPRDRVRTIMGACRAGERLDISREVVTTGEQLVRVEVERGAGCPHDTNAFGGAERRSTPR